MKKNSFLFFHFNLFFSSIDEDQRKLIIKKCYYPIIYIAKKSNIPINIEASARTLLEIKKIDKKFIKILKELIIAKKIYFVGSGYNQIISPLVPFEITSKNLEFGNYYYKKILGIRPETALINEMAFSETISEIYFDSGYKNIIIDFENLVLSPEDRKNKIPNTFFSNSKKNKINIIYASSYLFQQFQCCIYGDISINKYVHILNKYKNKIDISLPIYSGDAEIFNFRAGRFLAERKKTHDEWARVYELLDTITKQTGINFLLISSFKKNKFKNKIYNSSAEAPIIVKKQPKYNISRWAVTGRMDQKINTDCFKIFKNKKKIIQKIGKRNFYERLLDLWASDFRTHITNKRWKRFDKNLKYMLSKIKKEKQEIQINKNNNFNEITTSNNVYFDQEKTLLFINTSKIKIILNLRRGLSIESLAYKSHKFIPIIGTIHSYKTKSIYEGADFYSGHTTHEIMSKMLKITDLNQVKPKIYEDKSVIKIYSIQNLKYSKIAKTIEIKKNSESVIVNTHYKSNKKNIGSVRINNISFLNVNKKKIIYSCNNGGKRNKNYELKKYFDQSLPPTKFVSTTSGLGCTDSKLNFLIGKNKINFKWDNAKNFVLPSLQYKKIKNQKILRIFFCNQEYDETSHPIKSSYNFKLEINSEK